MTSKGINKSVMLRMGCVGSSCCRFRVTSCWNSRCYGGFLVHLVFSFTGTWSDDPDGGSEELKRLKWHRPAVVAYQGRRHHIGVRCMRKSCA